MSTYLAFYYLHVITVILSGSFFFVRGIWMLTASELLDRRFVKIAPHINDTLLLTAAIVIAVLTGQYPFVSDWLTAKFFALIAYIVLGIYALRLGPSLAVRAGCFLLALITFCYLVSVALTRSPWGPLAWL